ncbi:MAG: amino acid ABC transporter permease [Deinococcota bacterium]
MNYNWNWQILTETPYLGWLWSGLQLTLLVSSVAWVIAFILGSLIGVLRTLKQPVVRALATAYIEIFRSVPLLVHLFIWYFVLPEVLPRNAGRWIKRDLPYPEYWTATVCLGFYTASRVAEQVRSGIETIPNGILDAARALSLSQRQLYRFVLLPIGYRVIVPPLTSEVLTIFKNSSLALTIGVLELTAQSRQIENYTFQGFEAFTAATVLYIVITLIVVWLMSYIERWTRIPGYLSQETS